MRISVAVSLAVLAFLDVKFGQARTDEDLLSDPSYFWNFRIQPELRSAENMILNSCDDRNYENTESKLKIKEAFKTCIEPMSNALKFSRSENMQIDTVWTKLRSLEPLSAESLEFIKGRLLAPLCHHAPILLECFVMSFKTQIEKCWRPEEIKNLEYVLNILPSVCLYNGTRLEGILDTSAQDCLISYLSQFNHCYYGLSRNALASSNGIVEDSHCSTISCMIQLGKLTPCNATKEAQVSLQFLLEHIQFMRGCKTAMFVSFINEIHKDSCDSAQVPYNPSKYKNFIGECVEPFLEFADFLQHATNSTLEQTNHVGILTSDVASFTHRIDDICNEVLHDHRCAVSIQDVIHRCYTTKNQQWNAFVAYLGAFLQAECELGGARVIELFKDGDLQCLVSQISSVWTCFNDTWPEQSHHPEYDICANLVLLHSCSLKSLDKCTQADSFQIVKKTFKNLNRRIVAQYCKPALETQPFQNAKPTGHVTIAIIVFPISAAILFVILHFVVAHRRRRTRSTQSNDPTF